MIDAFQEPQTDCLVNFDCRTHNLVAQSVEIFLSYRTHFGKSVFYVSYVPMWLKVVS